MFLLETKRLLNGPDQTEPANRIKDPRLIESLKVMNKVILNHELHNMLTMAKFYFLSF